MKRQFEFYFNKKKAKQEFILKMSGLVFLVMGLIFFVYHNYSVTLYIILSIGIFIWFYLTLRAWVEYNLDEPAIIVNEKSLIFKQIDNFLKINETEVNIEEIKFIRTGLKLKDDNIQYKRLNLNLVNSEELKFDIDSFGLSHNYLYKLIIELNPEAKLLNFGEFEYE